MGWYAYVEADYGSEVLRVLLPNGTTGGKAILAFLMGLENYCSQSEDGKAELDLNWFENLQTYSTESLCSLTAPLRQATFSGNDEYRAGEHESEGTIGILNKQWVDIDALLFSVSQLLQLIKKANPQADEAWYDPIYSVEDFEALYSTLKLLKDRKNEVVRMRID